jgi:type IV pilus assembly protein PilP
MNISTKNRKISTFTAGFVILTFLAGCGTSDEGDLQVWMTEQKNSTKVKVEKLAEPIRFTPQPYGQEGSVDPFSAQKLTQALKRDSNQATSNAALITPELARRKEPLEAAPLDTVAMVGSMTKLGQPIALVRVDNLLYQVKLGNYIGQNYGRITKVSETGLVLREIVQDAGGEWIERTATLQLTEGSK